jgi:predicted ATP-binding protein involved in virulence
MEYFITQIDIKKVRHLENLTIKLSDTERKHLILTGKNGSGKTSVLEAMRDYLKSVEKETINDIKSSILKKLEDFTNIISLLSGSDNHRDMIHFYTLENITDSIALDVKHFNEYSSLHGLHNIRVSINHESEVSLEHRNNKFILVYFSAGRLNKNVDSNGINKIQLPIFEKIDNNFNKLLIQYLVNLQTRALYAEKKKDTETVTQIDTWFANFTKILQSIFQDNTLQLDFDIDAMNFNILTKGREKFDFTTLSDGYSAFLNIVTEIILRMESKAPKVYDIQGIVLIDEIETHLHIDLQKKIMPLLTTFFPKIQFIVTTHSPFVLSSISNAVIYDLEKHLRVEDLSSYAVDGIIEGYFDADKYSQEIKNKFEKYKTLLQKESPSIEEREELVDLRSELKDISAKLAPELAYDFKTLEISRLSKING